MKYSLDTNVIISHLKADKFSDDTGRTFIVSNVCAIPAEFMRRPLLFWYNSILSNGVM